MHLSLTDTKWGVAAQVAMGGVLRNWMVHNLQDQQVRRLVAWWLSVCSPTNKHKALLHT
jgi:hypothetical protein